MVRERERASGYTHIHEGWGHTKLTNDNVPMTTARGYFLIVANQTRALHPHWNYGIRIQYRKIFDKIGDMPFMWHSVSYIGGLSLSLTLALYRLIPMTIGISMFRFHILYAFCAYTDIQNCRSTTSTSQHSPQHSAPLGKFLTMRTPIALKRNRNCSKWCEDEDKLRILLF